MERQIEFDILKGLLICLMVVDHTPNPLRELTDQPLGYVSAAEGFVFISAYLFGLISHNKVERNGAAWLRRFAIKRACHLYLIHLGMLAFLFFTAGFLFQDRPAFSNFILPFFNAPAAALVSSLLLLYQPPLFDILPMYILFIAMTPAIAYAARHLGWNAVVTVSGLVWISGFVGGIGTTPANSLFGQLGLVVEPGAFRVWAWQFIWITGLALGQKKSTARHLSSPWLVVMAFCTAMFFFCWRNPRIPLSPDLGDWIWLLDKWQLGPLRLLNFFALVILLSRFGPSFKQLQRLLKPLSALGRSALPVFSLHICLAVPAIGVIETYQLNDWACVGVLGLQLALLFGYSKMRPVARLPARASPA